MSEERLEEQIMAIHAMPRMSFELSIMPDAGVTEEWQKLLDGWMAETKVPLMNESQDANIPSQGWWCKVILQECHLSSKMQFVQKVLLNTIDS